MAFQTILSAADLKKNLDNPEWAIMDCRFDLQESELGYQEYLAGHVPGSLYIHLDRDLSSEIIPGKTGRHPLPDKNVFSERLSSWGIDNLTQVVVYDNNNGGLAARLWWLLRWLGHNNVAILNGGWPAWDIENNPIETGESTREPRVFILVEQPQYIVDAEFVEKVRLDPDYLLVDSRAAERYWGINETTDPIAGHIPGAVTAPYAGNLDDQGFFLKTEMLKERFDILLEGIPAENVIFYCGSGVTASHNIVAMIEAGYEMPKLYPGSWSEWITDPSR
ncbi:MAG: sulfurtransferase [Anaerolineales bacterium]|nr:sulfurtransferase [Anaerolineales bacterium]